MKWKLTHTEQGMVIDNEGGKALGYDPNSGIQIIEEDGYAFKDLDNSGCLEPFEDWRLPISLRVRDFSTRFGLWQKDHRLYYCKGMIDLPLEMVNIMNRFQQEEFKHYLNETWDDEAYLRDHDILMVLLLMFDASDDQSKDSYLSSVIMQSMNLGVFENIVYSLWKAIRKFMDKEKTGKLSGQKA